MCLLRFLHASALLCHTFSLSQLVWTYAWPAHVKLMWLQTLPHLIFTIWQKLEENQIYSKNNITNGPNLLSACECQSFSDQPYSRGTNNFRSIFTILLHLSFFFLFENTKCSKNYFVIYLAAKKNATNYVEKQTTLTCKTNSGVDPTTRLRLIEKVGLGQLPSRLCCYPSVVWKQRDQL